MRQDAVTRDRRYGPLTAKRSEGRKESLINLDQQVTVLWNPDLFDKFLRMRLHSVAGGDDVRWWVDVADLVLCIVHHEYA